MNILNKKILFFILFFMPLLVCGQTPSWQWAKRIDLDTTSKLSNVRLDRTAVDKDGNVLAIGYARDTLHFDTPTGTLTIVPNISGIVPDNDILLVKYSTNGVVLWAKFLGGMLKDEGKDIAVDADGNIYIVGYVTNAGSGTSFDTVNLGFTPGASANTKEGFLAKLNHVGTTLWVKTFQGSMDDVATALALDHNKNVYITGFFETNINIGGTVLSTGQGFGDLQFFVAKFDKDGNQKWAQGPSSSAPAMSNTPYDICVDEQGNPYITGSFTGWVDFLGQTVTTNGQEDAFIAAFDANGQVRWANAIGTPGRYEAGDAITSDKNGHVYICGNYASTIDMYVGKYSALNGSQTWFKQYGNANNEAFYGLDLAPNGTLWATGRYYGPNLTIDAFTLTKSVGGPDLCLVSFDSATGTAQSAIKMPSGSGYADPFDLSIGANGKIAICGVYRHLIRFDSTLTITRTGAHTQNASFVAQYQTNSVPTGLNKSLPAEPNIVLFPNPAGNWLTVQVDQTGLQEYEIFDLSGRKISFGAFVGRQHGLNISNLARGTYVLIIKNQEGMLASKFVKQ